MHFVSSVHNDGIVPSRRKRTSLGMIDGTDVERRKIQKSEREGHIARCNRAKEMPEETHTSEGGSRSISKG